MKSVYHISQEVDNIQSDILSTNATRNDEATRLYQEQSDRFRPPFAVDRDRIIYSGAFRRYTGKTQVVYFASMLDEQLSSRSIHTLSVAQIARTIGRLLRLNIDLIEAIALGHDLGHPPFGHDGEKYLSKVSKEYGMGEFHHNVQSLRIVDFISKKGNGLNLTFQVREGLLSHDGEVHDQILVPLPDKTEEDLQAFVQAKTSGKRTSMMPMTLEGCVVRISDTIAYIGQDIEDAIRIGLIERQDLPTDCVEILGNNNGQIIETLVKDVVEQSYDKNQICFSKFVSDALLKLKKFNYKYIYRSEKLKINHDRIARGFDVLFSVFMEDLEKKNMISAIYKDFLNGKSGRYIDNSTDPEKVRDYISGMTDRYFAQILQRTILPEISLGDFRYIFK